MRVRDPVGHPFPRKKAAELVEAVSFEITDGRKRISFKGSMLQIPRTT
jgi:hypothetical protein